MNISMKTPPLAKPNTRRGRIDVVKANLGRMSEQKQPSAANRNTIARSSTDTLSSQVAAFLHSALLDMLAQRPFALPGATSLEVITYITYITYISLK